MNTPPCAPYMQPVPRLSRPESAVFPPPCRREWNESFRIELTLSELYESPLLVQLLDEVATSPSTTSVAIEPAAIGSAAVPVDQLRRLVATRNRGAVAAADLEV